MTLPDISDIDQRIGAILRAERLQAGLKQEELACALGLDRTTLSRYEAGSRSVPVGVLLQIAMLLRIPFNKLVPGSATLPLEDMSQQALSSEVQVIARTLGQRPDLVPQVLELLTLLLEHESLVAKDT